MQAENPYQAPTAPLTSAHGAAPVLAGRGLRLGAAIIDTLIAFGYAVPLMFALGTFDYIERGQEPPLPLVLLASLLSFVAFLLVHGYFLHTAGQTVGKKLLGIRIVDLQGRLLPLGRLLGRRYVPITAASLVPVIGPLLGIIDVLLVFRADRRCVHDLIAGTRVVVVTWPKA